MGAIERIRQYIENQGISERKFFIKTTLPMGAFNKIKSVGSENLQKISLTFPELNMDWVITGRGEMIIDPHEKFILKEHDASYKTDKDLTIERLEKHLLDKQKMIEMLEQQLSKKTSVRVNDKHDNVSQLSQPAEKGRK